MPGDLEAGAVGDAGACERPVGEDVGVVGVEGAVRGDLQRAVVGGEGPEVFARAGKAQQEAVVALGDQVVRGLRRAAGGEIGGGGEEDALAVGDGAHLEARVLSVAEGEGDVDAFREVVDLAVGEPEPDLDAGEGGVEVGDERRHDAAADAERRGDDQRAARLQREGGDGGLDSSIASSTRLAVS